MKRFSLFLIAFCAIPFINRNAQINDDKAELIITKQKLFEAELELMKKQLNSSSFNKDSIELLFLKVEKLEKEIINTKKQYTYPAYYDSIVVKPDKNTWEFNFFRLFEGSIELTYERLITSSGAIDISLYGTYAYEHGVGQRYVNDYSYEDYDDDLGQNIYFEADKMYGGGIELKWKKYMLAGKNVGKKSGWKGLYIAPSIMYRGVVYEGKTRVHQNYNEGFINYTTKNFTNTLNIGKLAFLIGNKHVISDTFVLDFFIGGAIRYCEYSKHDLNRYSSWVDLDYTGIMPVFGLKFGVANL